MHQKGFAHVLLLVVLLIGLAFGVYLVQQKTNLFSRASSAPISGPIFEPQPTIFEPQSTVTPVRPQPTSIPKTGACANSDGNGANKVKCNLTSYNASKSIKDYCPSREAYPYYYSDCVVDTSGGPCPVGFHVAVENGISVCIINNPPQIGGCADSDGNGFSGLKCDPNSYDSSRSTKNYCPNRDLYPYYYTSCQGGSVKPTPVTSSVCADECYSDDLRTNIGKVSGQCNSGVSSTSHLCSSSKQGTTQVCNGRTYSCNGSYWQ